MGTDDRKVELSPWLRDLPADTREWVRRNTLKAPPLTDEQRSRLAELLRPARQHQRKRNRDAA